MPFYFFKCEDCKKEIRKFTARNKDWYLCECGGTARRGFGMPLGVRAMETADARRGISVPQGLEKMIEDRAKSSEQKGRYSEDEE
jgi:hypothetical protein